MIRECSSHSVRSKQGLKGITLQMPCPREHARNALSRVGAGSVCSCCRKPSALPKPSLLPSWLRGGPFSRSPTFFTALLLPWCRHLFFYYILRLSRARAAMAEGMGWPKRRAEQTQGAESVWAPPSAHPSLNPSLIQQRIAERWWVRDWRCNAGQTLPGRRKKLLRSRQGFPSLSYLRVWCIQKTQHYFFSIKPMR